ncbi:hypothetical protein GRI75_09530 [Altererythrobacter soli]|uniref:Uncharacterized protein n=1 Tax=Croceibacterium soli TaxID=1739690 RepID=A0A6I4USZ6_9SPHN|nr:hypothetical protein [Croceibacterium soli]MXP41881.1 hypothetical protein [Croceibacterium soli]
MFQDKFEVFDAGQPLLPGASTITIAQALVCEQLLVALQDAPTPEDSGEAILASAEFRTVKAVHLEAERIRILDVPVAEDAMRERIDWMWHAGSRSSNWERVNRAAEAIDVMVCQVAPEGEIGPDDEAGPRYDDASQSQFNPETLAEDLAALEVTQPELVAALFRGDLDDAPGLIDDAVHKGAVRRGLVGPVAWMFVCWAALEQQREAALGWRLIHKQLDEVWGDATSQRWTIGQIFKPETKRHAFAHEMLKLYFENLKNDVERIEDKRTVNRLERRLRKMGLGGINRASEKEILSAFGENRFGCIPALLQHFADEADVYHRRYRSFLVGPDGVSLAGRRADVLTAPISAVHRTAIVCARTCDLAGLAAKADTTDDLRKMLDTHLPEVLRPCKGKRFKQWSKFRLRQLFHVVRIEFLQDGEHLPKHLKGADPGDAMVPLELSEEESRRGHELFNHCWAELCNQPADWRFITAFGWQCDGSARVRLSAPA